MSVPVPTNVRAINGNPGKRALQPAGEPDPKYLKDFTPPYFLTDEVALGFWDYLAPRFAEARLLCEVDVETFARYCKWLAEFWRSDGECSELTRAPGGSDNLMVLVGEKGGRNYHPAYAVRNRAAEQCDRLAQQFGASPVARTKIRTNPQEDLWGNDFESFVRALHEQRQVA